MEQRWLTGEKFGLADCAMAPYFQTLQQFDWLQMLDSYPHVMDWLKRVMRRDSYKKAVSNDFTAELLEKTQKIGRDAWPIIERHFNK